MSRNEALRYRMDSLGSSGDDADEGVGAMADYIRGKKTYTKWDADTDNVDMDLSPEAPHVQVATSPGWFSGTKGRVLRVLIVGVIFLGGAHVRLCGTQEHA
ncbi:hypothetical protein MTO96_047635 [Rhipicephalus appendiculatus]